MHWVFTLAAYVALSEAKPYLWMKRQQSSTPPYVTNPLSHTTTGTATQTVSSLTIYKTSSYTLLTTDSSTLFTTSSPTPYTASSFMFYIATNSASYTVSNSTSHTISSHMPYTSAISTSYAAASSTLPTLENPSPYIGTSLGTTDTHSIPMIVGIVLALVFIVMGVFFFIRYKRKHAAVNNRPVTQHKIGIIAATFTPTLYDEMDVQIGDQVRVLIEFDDGWCQGINLNNNTMGVFPRHCLEGIDYCIKNHDLYNTCPQWPTSSTHLIPSTTPTRPFSSFEEWQQKDTRRPRKPKAIGQQVIDSIDGGLSDDLGAMFENILSHQRQNNVYEKNQYISPIGQEKKKRKF
ncbi:unnamed protein product [Rhizopus stolonifer]